MTFKEVTQLDRLAFSHHHPDAPNHGLYKTTEDIMVCESNVWADPRLLKYVQLPVLTKDSYLSHVELPVLNSVYWLNKYDHTDISQAWAVLRYHIVQENGGKFSVYSQTKIGGQVNLLGTYSTYSKAYSKCF